jgi:hypothetical protein
MEGEIVKLRAIGYEFKAEEEEGDVDDDDDGGGGDGEEN